MPIEVGEMCHLAPLYPNRILCLFPRDIDVMHSNFFAIIREGHSRQRHQEQVESTDVVGVADPRSYTTVVVIAQLKIQINYKTV